MGSNDTSVVFLICILFICQHPHLFFNSLILIDVLWPQQEFQPFLYFLHGSPSHHGSFFSPPLLSGVPAAGVLFWDSRSLQSWQTWSTATSLCLPPAPRHDFPWRSGQPVDLRTRWTSKHVMALAEGEL